MLLLLVFPILVSTWAKIVPEQVHLSFHGNMSVMAVAWITMQDDHSSVFYGTDASSLSHTAVDSGKQDWEYGGIHRFSHRALMTGLKPRTKYYYKINDRLFSFTTLADDIKYFRACIFGDLGYYHGNSTASLIKNGLAGNFDFIIHIGDIAYDLHSDNGQRGDKYMNELEPLISTIPYMVIAGNHENDDRNFSNFQERFWMPHNGFHDNQFYGFTVGLAHFVGVSTEYYAYYNYYGKGPVYTQYNYLDKEISSVDRSKTPWLIAYQHRPFYCSSAASAQCMDFDNRMIREGWSGMPGMEPLYLKHKVDMAFWGHEHAYERNWPIADKKYWVGNQYLHNAPAPVYVMSGSAGCHTPATKFGDPWKWSAVRSYDYGYSILSVHNSTHIHMKQLSIDKNGEYIDDFWLSKDTSHAYSPRMQAELPGEHMADCDEKTGTCTDLNDRNNMNMESIY